MSSRARSTRYPTRATSRRCERRFAATSSSVAINSYCDPGGSCNGNHGPLAAAASFRYTQVTDLAREALNNAYRMHGLTGHPDDIQAFLELQAKVELFDDTEEALSDQQKLGVKVLIYSDVETKYLDMYVSKFKSFRADFVGSTEQAGIAKPNPRTYQWVLRKTGME